MKRAKLFARRNLKEMLRDKLGCIFFAGFPLAMLVMFRLIAHYAEVDLEWFEMPYLLPGIVIFAYAFVMLYTALLVAKDKSTAFLVRLYASPMRSHEYIIGYAVPGVVIGVLQTVICFAAGNLILLAEHTDTLDFSVLPELILATLPALFLFIFLGIFFGACLNEKSAPGVSSIIISLSGVLSGAWMPLQTMGKLETFATYLPFYPAVRIGRYFTVGKTSTVFQDILVVFAYTVVMFVLATAAFRRMTKRDNR